jgi:hypothetical protein
MATGKGKNKNGTDCGNRLKESQDYCWRHPDQAPNSGQGGEGLRIRERLEVVIEANGGTEGLDIAGADLSELDLSGMDLHGIVFYRGYEDRKPLLLASTSANCWSINRVV